MKKVFLKVNISHPFHTIHTNIIFSSHSFCIVEETQGDENEYRHRKQAI